MVIHRPVYRPGVGRRKAADLIGQSLAGRIAPLAAEGSLPARLLAVALEYGFLLCLECGLLRRECRLCRSYCEHLVDGAVHVVLHVGHLAGRQPAAVGNVCRVVGVVFLAVPADTAVYVAVVVAVADGTAGDTDKCTTQAPEAPDAAPVS